MKTLVYTSEENVIIDPAIETDMDNVIISEHMIVTDEEEFAIEEVEVKPDPLSILDDSMPFMDVIEEEVVIEEDEYIAPPLS